MPQGMADDTEVDLEPVELISIEMDPTSRPASPTNVEADSALLKAGTFE
jgi:hypothetical protein